MTGWAIVSLVCLALSVGLLVALKRRFARGCETCRKGKERYQNYSEAQRRFVDVATFSTRRRAENCVAELSSLRPDEAVDPEGVGDRWEPTRVEPTEPTKFVDGELVWVASTTRGVWRLEKNADPRVVKAPWTPAQVESLRGYQACGYLHEYAGDGGVPLVPTTDGWVEREGGPVVQTWAHLFSCDDSWKGMNPFSHRGTAASDEEVE